MVAYYGSETPLNQLANVTVEEGLASGFALGENLIGDVEKAIMKSNLGLNPSNNGDTIRGAYASFNGRDPQEYTKQAKQEAENARCNTQHQARCQF